MWWSRVFFSRSQHLFLISGRNEFMRYAYEILANDSFSFDFKESMFFGCFDNKRRNL